MSQAPTLTKANSRPRAMNELALFAGAGGGILGGQILGWRTVCAVEREPYAAGVLVARQNDGFLAPFPIWDDVCTFDGRPWRGIVDVVSGGFPCQDISVAGKGAGIDGERSGLWGEMARIIGEVRPRFAFVENSPALVNRGLGRVLGDLAALGYDCRWTVLSASDVGAPHRRERIWIVANARCGRLGEPGVREVQQQGRAKAECAGSVADTARVQPGRTQQRPEWQRTGARGESVFGMADPDQQSRHEGRTGDTAEIARGRDADRGSVEPHGMADTDSQWQLQQGGPVGEVGGWIGDSGLSDAGRANVERLGVGTWGDGSKFSDIGNAGWWLAEPDVGRVAHGVAARVDRLKAIGNGQVPQCAAAAWRLLTS